MKLLCFLVCLIVSQCAFAQIKVVKLDSASVPKFAKYKGSIDTAVRYWDKDGEHILIASYYEKDDTTELVMEKADGKGDSTSVGSSDTRSAYLYAYNYLVTGKTAKLLWQMKDFVEECGEDVTAYYLPATFAVTDLDHNGQAEVWLMYKLNCAGDVSPVTMKVIMHQGAQKYAMRGDTKVVISGRNYGGGTYSFDDAFNKAPEIFKEHARLLWKKNLMEHFQQQ